MIPNDLIFYTIATLILCSFFACLYQIFTFLRIKNPSYTLKIISWIALSDLIQAIVEVINIIVYQWQSKDLMHEPEISKYDLLATNLASLFWSFALSLFSYRTASLKVFNHRKFYNVCLGIIFPLAIGLAILPFLMEEKYGKNSEVYAIFYVICVPAPLIFGLLISIYCYCCQVIQIKKNLRPSLIKKLNIRIEKLTWYPLLMLIAYGPITAYTVLEKIYEIPDFVWFLCSITFVSSGWINTIAYLYVRKIQKKENREEVDSAIYSKSSNSDVQLVTSYEYDESSVSP